MSDSKRDELTTHDVQTRCAQRADTNDLARGQRTRTARGKARDTRERRATKHANGTRQRMQTTRAILVNDIR